MNCSDLNSLNPFEMGKLYPVRDGYGKALVHLGKVNRNVYVLDADLATSTRSDWFAKCFPDRFIDVGIAEQNMINVAAGLSLMGKIPFATTYGVFVCGRAFDQIRNTICYSNLNVKIVGSHGGLSVGPDGGSHQAIEDIALMNVLPGMTVLCPVDANEAFQMTLFAAGYNGPVFIRLAREATEIVTEPTFKFTFKKAGSLKEGSDGYMVFHSTIGANVLEAAEILREKYKLNMSVINFSTVKPFDEGFADIVAGSGKPVFVVEEHLKNGGLGSVFATYLANRNFGNLHIRAIEDVFGESGTPLELHEKYGFTSFQIAEWVAKTLIT